MTIVAGCPHCRMARRSFIGGGVAALAAATSAMSPGAALAAAIGKTGGQVIDFHTHLYDEGLPAILDVRKSGVNGVRWYEQMRSPLAHIAHMKRIGVDAHVVGVGNAVHGISWGDARRDLELYRASNDRIARNWVAAHPGRFFGSFGLPTQDLRLAIPELERSVRKLGLSVLQLSSVSADGRYYGDPSFDPLWEAVQELGIPVFIHPHGQDRKPPFDKFFLNNSVGQGVEEIKVMVSMIYNGLFEKFPRLNVVIAHAGGFLPHYYGRLDRNATERPETMKNLRKLPSEYLKNFYYDSCVYAPEILAALVRIVGVERIVLGSDFPVGEDDGLSTLKRTPGLSAADVDLIARRTPTHLLARASRRTR